MADDKIKIGSILLLIIFINAAGFLLKYYELDSYIIFVGFRFYISLILPFFIICRFSLFDNIKELFIHPLYNKTFQPLVWIFLPLLISLSFLYFTKQIGIGDPDYFYEFGLSSIFDYPLYVIWNLPHLLVFALFVILIQPAVKNKLSLLFIITLSCFVFVFFPIGSGKIDYLDIISLILIVASAVLILRYYQNIYWFSIIIFTILWTNILAFGSGSQLLIHILFASKYESWDGFFDVSKNLHSYLLPVQSGITFIIIVCSVLLRKIKTDIVEKKS
ncbi:MAG: hypothetical protein WCA84_10385 [Ignavibacteriaceae bacterium]